MGLIHWWPLQGDLNDHAGNIPLSSGTATGNYSFPDTGKFGKCIALVNQNLNVTNPFIDLDNWSLSFWFKNDGVYQWGDPICWSTNYSRLEITTGDGSGWAWYRNDLASGNVFGSPGRFLADGQLNHWYNITIVKKGTQATFYLDGVIKLTYSSSGNFTSASDKMFFNSRGSISENNGKMSLCDIRCYDHALSEAEMHELKSGLLLHYNFEDYTGSKNLITNPNSWTSTYASDSSGSSTKGKFTVQSDGSVLVEDNNSNTRFMCVQNPAVTAGDVLTVSIKYKNVSGDQTFRWQFSELNSSNSLTTAYWSTGRQKEIDIGDGWKIIYYTITIQNANTTKIRFWLQDGADYTLYTHSYYLKDFKAEKGETDNPIFETTGYTTIYDGSGNELHGIATDVENRCDAATGKHSAYFPLTGSHYITIPNPPLDNTNVSVSAWWKSSNKSPKGTCHIVFATKSPNASYSSIEISISSDGQLRWGFVINNTRTTRNTAVNPQLHNGAWRHIVITYDGVTEKAYVDGVQIASFSTAGTISYTTSKDTYIGKYVREGFGATDAYISDVRVYNTTLNLDDIKRLYKHSVKVTPEQKLIGECLIEQNAEIIDYYNPSNWKTSGWSGTASIVEEGVLLNAANGWRNFALLTPSNLLGQDLVFSFDYKWTGNLPDNAWVWQNTKNAYSPVLGTVLIKDNNIWHHYTVVVPSAQTYIGINNRGVDNSGLNYPLIVRNISLQPASNKGVQVYPTGCVNASRYGDSNKTQIIKAGNLTANDFIEQ